MKIENIEFIPSESSNTRKRIWMIFFLVMLLVSSYLVFVSHLENLFLLPLLITVIAIIILTFFLGKHYYKVIIHNENNELKFYFNTQLTKGSRNVSFKNIYIELTRKLVKRGKVAEVLLIKNEKVKIKLVSGWDGWTAKDLHELKNSIDGSIKDYRNMADLGAKFLWSCKSAYLKGLNPFDFDNQDKEEYKSIIETGKSLLRERGLQDFIGFLMEGQYYVHLWAAFIALEHGNIPNEEKLKYDPSQTILQACLVKVERYINQSENADFKKNGELWLKKILMRPS